MRKGGLLVLSLVGCGSFGTDPSTSTAASADGGAASDGGACPGKHGPVGVRAGSYCIDATEVTRGQHAEFVAAPASERQTPIPACATNTSYEPRNDWPAPPGTDRYPVWGVDWCDAYDFCR